MPVWGQLSVVARLFAGGLAEGQELAATDQRPDVAARRALWQAEKARRARDDRGLGVSSAAVFAALTRQCPEDAVIAVDVGNNAYSFGRYFECTRQAVLMSGYLGSIGFGYPAAMGAWAATRGARPICAVTGDGGFAQYMAELLTAVKHDMNITHVLLNNGQLGKISKEQRAGEWDGLADLAAQPRLLAVRRAVRGARDPGHRRRAARHGARKSVRARRPGARRGHDRPGARLSPSRVLRHI